MISTCIVKAWAMAGIYFTPQDLQPKEKSQAAGIAPEGAPQEASAGCRTARLHMRWEVLAISRERQGVKKFYKPTQIAVLAGCSSTHGCRAHRSGIESARFQRLGYRASH